MSGKFGEPYGSIDRNGVRRNLMGHLIDKWGNEIGRYNDEEEEEEEEEEEGGGSRRRRPSRKSTISMKSKKSKKSSRKYKKSAKRVFRNKSRSTRRR